MASAVSMKPMSKTERLTLRAFCAVRSMSMSPTNGSPKCREVGQFSRLVVGVIACVPCLLWSSSPAAGLPQGDSSATGLVQEIAAPLADVQQALDEVLHDQTIHGTYVFEKERTLTGAIVVSETALFERWKDAGNAFYKLRTQAIAPRHFVGSADQGTIAVRYIVTSLDANRTRLRINAVFVETSHRMAHPSDGTVESSEFKVFQEHLLAIQFAEQEALDTKRRRDGIDLARRTLALQYEDESTRLSTAVSSVEDLEHRIHALRRQLERRVKAPGANLKAAPFRSAANVTNLSAYTDVVIVVVTPRWFGIETPDGQRGWLPLDQLEPLP
jgi:hypothetical protein